MWIWRSLMSFHAEQKTWLDILKARKNAVDLSGKTLYASRKIKNGNLRIEANIPVLSRSQRIFVRLTSLG